ncbi:MAG: hypothetical protein GHHEDOFH_00799 [Pseudorhodoplanes sp.]|nr:hypothetical protein [Pseudorhodoplanes sp.]
MSESEKVGYKRPPKAHRFKPGESGNPRGRPKGTRNLGTDLTDILGRRVSIREDGKERRISRQEALLLSLYNKALHGDVRAATAIINMLSKLAPSSAEPPETVSLSESDERILADFLRRRTSVTKADE